MSFFSYKHFKYLYQEEIRYTFLPPHPIQKLDPLFLKLGSLADIAEILNRKELEH